MQSGQKQNYNNTTIQRSGLQKLTALQHLKCYNKQQWRGTNYQLWMEPEAHPPHHQSQQPHYQKTMGQSQVQNHPSRTSCADDGGLVARSSSWLALTYRVLILPAQQHVAAWTSEQERHNGDGRGDREARCVPAYMGRTTGAGAQSAAVPPRVRPRNW